MTAKKTPKKTDALTLRLDPRTKFLIELLARSGHQSITGVIESAVTRLAGDRRVDGGQREESLAAVSALVWAPSESERIVNLALCAPSLMSHEESCIASVLDSAVDIFFNVYEIGGSADYDYRMVDAKAGRGGFRQSSSGVTIFVTPKRKLIRLSWDLIKSRALELAEKGYCPDLTLDDVESFIGRPVSSLTPEVKVPAVVIHDDDGVGYMGADKEFDDISDSLGVKR